MNVISLFPGLHVCLFRGAAEAKSRLRGKTRRRSSGRVRGPCKARRVSAEVNMQSWEGMQRPGGTPGWPAATPGWPAVLAAAVAVGGSSRPHPAGRAQISALLLPTKMCVSSKLPSPQMFALVKTVVTCLLNTVSFNFPFALSLYIFEGGLPAALASSQLTVVTQVLIMGVVALEAKGCIWLLSNGRSPPATCGGSCPKPGAPAWELRLYQLRPGVDGYGDLSVVPLSGASRWTCLVARPLRGRYSTRGHRVPLAD